MVKLILPGNSTDTLAIQLLLRYLNRTDLEVQVSDSAKVATVQQEGSEIVGTMTTVRFLVYSSGKSFVSLIQRESLDSYYLLQFVNIFRTELQGAVEQKNSAKIQEIITTVDASLVGNTYVVGHQISIADVFLYAIIYPTITSLTKFTNLQRWFDLIQFHAPWSDGLTGGVSNLIPYVATKKDVPAFKFSPLVVEKPAEKKPEAKKDEKKDAKAEAPKANDAKKDDKKADKKDDKKKADAKPATPAALAVEEKLDDPSVLDIRVAKILKAYEHPKADKLYVEEIDVGESAPRQVCSGLKGKIPLSELQDKVLLVVCNLKPAPLVGIMSQAMVLVASEGDKHEIPAVPAGAKIGERVIFGNATAAPLKEIGKEYLFKLFPALKTNDKGEFTFNGHVANTSAGPVVSNFKNAPVK